MKTALLVLPLAFVALAQDPAPRTAEPKPEAAAAGEAPAAESESPAAETASSGLEQISGSFEFGYRWRGVGGNPTAYRSVVDLGEGPKLLSFDFGLAASKWWDNASIRGLGWGGDPYTTAGADFEKSRLYRVRFDYRNLVYYNFLPSFANPNLDRGLLGTQSAFDTSRRFVNAEIELMPGRRIVPYAAYTQDWGKGTGLLNFVADGNEYPAANRLNDRTSNVRGGVHIDASRMRVTLEQGGTGFRDDSDVFDSGRNTGNRTAPVLGQTLFTSSLSQLYRATGNSIYSKALLSAGPASWIDVTAQFLYSQPHTEVQYTEDATGRFAVLSRLLFFDRMDRRVFAEAKQPNTTASLGVELRPVRRLRIIESWMTDRRHNASGLSAIEAVLNPQAISLGDRLAFNYHQQQLDALVDVTRWLTLRGGHRYVWGDAGVRAPVSTGGGAVLERGELKRHSGLGGFALRPFADLTVNAEAEVARGDRNYYRTSLQDFERVTARARYRLSTSLGLGFRTIYLRNGNPDPSIGLDFLSRQTAATLDWRPNDAKRWSVLAEYGRSTIRSDIFYRIPQSLMRDTSVYRDNAHTASALIEAHPIPRLEIVAGGAVFASSGTRPTTYWQPTARVAAQVAKQWWWTAEYRYYGLHQDFQLFEGFRSPQFTTGFRWRR